MLCKGKSGASLLNGSRGSQPSKCACQASEDSELAQNGPGEGLMARCVAFDKETAQAVSTNLHLLTVCDPLANPLTSALQSKSPQALLALPADDSGRILLARFQRNPRPPCPATPLSDGPVTFEAGGFLGLSDEPVFDAEPPASRKWWQKLLD